MSWVSDTFFGGNEKKAGEISARASEAALAEQRRQFDIATGLARPAIDSGNVARDQLMQLLGLSTPPTQNPSGIGQPSGGFDSLSRDPRGGEFGSGLSGTLRRLIAEQDARQNPPANTGVAPQSSAPQQDPIDIIRNTPGYQFQTEQGTRALNANRSAGGATGGALMKDFARFNQGVASSFYSDYANRLAGLAGSAQTASTNLGQQGIASGQLFANSIQNAGDARASGLVGKGNAAKGTITDIVSLIAGL